MGHQTRRRYAIEPKESMPGHLFHNIRTLITNAPLAGQKRCNALTAADLGPVDEAWLAIDTKVCAYGQGRPPEKYSGFQAVDCHGGLLLPGLIDCHTHPVFAGNRTSEFSLRLGGATYQEIAAKGGGIKSTVNATRQATTETLVRLTQARLQSFLSWGVTGVEVKSGYGLGVQEELKLLRVLQECKRHTPQALSVTLLALHAMPPGESDIGRYVATCTDQLLPLVVQEKLADSVDAFVENGYFSVADTKPYFSRARDLGLSLRLHADEFADSGAALWAAELGAKSADHLQHASPAGISAMAAAGVVAVLLPGTSLYTKIPYTSGKPFLAAGCAVALATDFNPGSSVFNNLNFIASLAALHCGLNAPQALAGVTYVPAHALGWAANKGHLSPGADADCALFPHQSVDEWIADFGRTPPSSVWICGKQVAGD